MYVHMHTHTPQSQLSFLSVSKHGREGATNLLVIKASGSGLAVPFPEKFFYFIPKFLCIFLLWLSLSLPVEFFCLPRIKYFESSSE